MRTLSIFSLAVLIIACGKPDHTMTMKGNIEGGAGKYVRIQAFDGTGALDSALVAEDGSFALKMQNKALDFYRFYIEDARRPIVLILDSTQRDIQLSAKADELLDSYIISGSKDSEIMHDFYARRFDYTRKMDSLQKMMNSLPQDIDPITSAAVNGQIMGMQTQYEEEMKKMAMDNLRSPAALSIISTVDLMKAMPEYKAVSAGLAQVIPSSPFLQTMNKNIAAAEQRMMQQQVQEQAAGSLTTGAPAPEIKLNTPEGKELSLSSLKGKYVLIDFWASWCGPCRRENPNVLQLYNKYKKKNFEILSVSLDSDKAKWTAAIQQDQMNWLHVSDLEKWNSVAARDYGVSSIPFTVLVDPDGNVIATKLRGPGLESKLAEIFGS